MFGVGNGWNQDEMENHGTNFATRHKLARERIEAMKAIWTQPTAEYHGEFVNFAPMQAWPKPVQTPHPPILVGGAFPLQRAARHPLWRRLDAADDAIGDQAPLTDLIPRFRQMAAEAGRDPAKLQINIGGQSGGCRTDQAVSGFECGLRFHEPAVGNGGDNIAGPRPMG